MSVWTSNATVEEVGARLIAARRCVLLTHAKPDGDAAGSTLAVARALLTKGVEAEPWYVGPFSRWMPEIVAATKVRHLSGGESMRFEDGAAPTEEPECIAVLDTGSWPQLRETRAWLEPRADRAVLIDHHLHGDPATAALRLIDQEAAATTQIAARVCCVILGVKSPRGLPKDVAEPLYLGLATDTGWFRHSNVTPAVFTLAADLLAAGADSVKLYETIEQRENPARLRLLSRALGTLELVKDGTVAFMSLKGSDYEGAGAERNDSTGFIDAPLSLEGVRVSVLLIEEDGGKVTKISLRSKATGDPVDVNEVARRMGGGGHARASGARVEAGIESAKRAVLGALL